MTTSEAIIQLTEHYGAKNYHPLPIVISKGEGVWVEDADGNFQVRKHTVDMPPGSKRSYRVRADALGRWAYHCHLFFHMESGMFREVRVEE